MKTRHLAHILLLSAAVIALLSVTAACSTQKNTAKTRWWHSFNARYNTYYNGSLAYIDGSLEKENGNKDNFTEIIPLYTVGNKSSRETGKANFERAIEKCQKAIKLHSIKRRPVWDKKRRKTERDIEWLQRKEYNPFLWKAWLLMGRSQFHKGAFDEAASTFAYMSRLYQTQPAIYGRARAWLAKSYIEEGWMYDAEDVIRNMRRDSIHWRAQKEWDYTFADYYIHSGDYAKAVPYLRKVIAHEMRRKQKAREWYLMGQLESALGHKDKATKAFRRVIRLNPPYEVEFNARIALTEVLSSGGQGKKMISRLKRMAASDKNKDYLDQVYYAIGNIYLSQRDTANAITAYERGNNRATRAGIEKGVLLLKLGDLYWAKEKYNDAQRCYGEAIGLLDKERPDYQQLSDRSKVLDELVPYTDAVHLQDSLQYLAKTDEKTRNEAIDRVIEALKKKEKEERDRKAEQDAQETIAKNGGNTGASQGTNRNNTQQTTQQNKGLWYFYNQMAINQGKQDFQKRWGKRENVDNWQRVNKTVVALAGSDGSGLTQEQTDSIAAAEAAADSLSQKADSAQNDPHRREYYLAQIPFSEEQIAESNGVIMDGLYHSGVIFKDKLDNLALSQKALSRLETQYPDYENMADVYYHLFLLYSRKGEEGTAQTYIDKLKDKYPEHQWTTLLTDPYFKENATLGTHMEDSLYAATYDAFKADRYAVVKANAALSEKRFPVGANRDKFMFVSALTTLNEGDAEGCVDALKQMLKEYPQSGLAEMAGMIVRGVGEGRRLRGGTFDIGNVWEQRTATLNVTDSTAVKTLSAERNTDFLFIIAYPTDSVNENRLLFELAKYNFTSYMVRNFDIAIDDQGALHTMQVSGFRNYDEALQYARQLYAGSHVMQIAAKGRGIIISSQNLPLLGRQFSYDDYDRFYARHFAPLKTSDMRLLDEPDFTPSDSGNDEPQQRKADEPEAPETDGGSTLVPIEEEPANDGGSTIVPIEETPNTDDGAGSTVVPVDDKADEPSANGTTVMPLDVDNTKSGEPEEQGSGTTIVPIDEPAKRTDEPATKPTQVVPRPTKQPQKPAVEPQKSNEEPQKPVAEPQLKPLQKPTIEDDFYFDDSAVPASPGSGKDKKDDPSALEDEYYDLDGF